MAIKTELPSPHLIEPALKDILKDLGIAPIVLNNWGITIEEDYTKRCYEINLKWRTYRIRKFIDKNDLTSRNIDKLLQIGRLITNELCKYNAAEDEEHMEALILLSMRPTNGLHHKQL